MILDGHVALPFETMWMRSARKAPWINGTRPELAWGVSREFVRLCPRVTMPATEIKLEEKMGRLLRPFLASGVASARTVRAHGLIAKNVSILDPDMCFIPNIKAIDAAKVLWTAK